MLLTCRQGDVLTLRNTQHSTADRCCQFKANCWTIEAGFDFCFFPANLSMFSGVRWELAGSPILAGLLFPLQGDAPRMGRETAGFTACPPSAPPSANQSSSSAHSQHCCFASASGGKDTPAWSFKQHGTSSVRRPTQHSWHLSHSRSAFTLGKHIESFKPCLPTLILTSSPLRRTQPAESNTEGPHICVKSTLAKNCQKIQREESRYQLNMAGTPVNHFNIGDWVESERDDTRGL